MKNEEKKKNVRSRYDQIAGQAENQQSGCCSSTSCCGDGGTETNLFNEDYSHVEGYNEEADLGLGCGIPSDYAGLKYGDTVLDIGSGAGNDCFVARSFVGANGFVYGIDFSDEMIYKARQNTEKLGYKNIAFVKGDIENMPFDSASFDKIISNCVLNLVPDKQKAFQEMYRLLVAGGSFCVSDVVISGHLPEALLNDPEMYTSCIAGALDRSAYLETIRKAKFKEINVHKEKQIEIPAELLQKHMDKNTLNHFYASNTGIYSITVSGKK